jgi:hypothetical protein
MSRKPCLFAMVTAFLFMFAVLSASAQQVAKGKTPGNADVKPGAASQQVSVDKTTGKIRKPTPEEVQQLVKGMKLNDSVQGLTPKRVGMSTVAVDLQGRFQNVLLAKKNPNGTLSQACVVSQKDGEDFLKSDAPANNMKSDPSTWEVK